jgi:transcriptional regulator GlxA family with amidase domain
MVAFPDVQSLDVVGPTEVFSIVDRLAAAARDGSVNPAVPAAPIAPPSTYSIELVTASGEGVRTSSGIELRPHTSLNACRGPIDTLMVAGGAGVRDAARDEGLISWLQLAAQRSRRVTSICTGAFILARAGLLDGRRATTHWDACDALARRYPQVTVDSEPIFVRDGNVHTSAGVTAGIDLALALVEEDHGARVALAAARQLVLFVRRPGGQAQFSAGIAAQAAHRPGIRDLQQWMADRLDRDLSVPALAERCFMSPRNFARVFAREVGMTPAAYVESVRLERARVLLETTELSVDEIARRCGFGTVETLRRVFARRLRASPSDYRSRFNVIPLRKGA